MIGVSGPSETGITEVHVISSADLLGLGESLKAVLEADFDVRVSCLERHEGVAEPTKALIVALGSDAIRLVQAWRLIGQVCVVGVAWQDEVPSDLDFTQPTKTTPTPVLQYRTADSEAVWRWVRRVRSCCLHEDGQPILLVGLCGLGSIGMTVAHGIQDGLVGPAQLVAVASARGREDVPTGLAEVWCANPAELVSRGARVVVEAATQAVARQWVIPWLQSGADVVVMSVGVFADHAFARQVRSVARGCGRRVFIPAGAVAGIDAVQAIAATQTVNSVHLRTTKPASSLDVTFRPDDSKRTKRVFKGLASQAALLYPKNMNVAQTIALATNMDPIVELVADPAATTNTHRLRVQGAFGSLELITDNAPHPDNPKTSQLACLSVLSTLRRLGESMVIGM